MDSMCTRQTGKATVWAARAAVAVVFFAATHAQAEDTAPKKVEFRVVVGAKSIVGAGWAFIPMPLVFQASADFAKYLRVHVEMTHHLAENLDRPGIGGGAAFCAYGREAARKGGFQLKIPLLAEIAWAFGTLEAGDGYDERIRWMLIGASTGLDFTWWKAGKVGFHVGLTGGYLFRVDLGSDYADGYSTHDDVKGVIESALLVGVAF